MYSVSAVLYIVVLMVALHTRASTPRGYLPATGYLMPKAARVEVVNNLAEPRSTCFRVILTNQVWTYVSQQTEDTCTDLIPPGETAVLDLPLSDETMKKICSARAWPDCDVRVENLFPPQERSSSDEVKPAS